MGVFKLLMIGAFFLSLIIFMFPINLGGSGGNGGTGDDEDSTRLAAEVTFNNACVAARIRGICNQEATMPVFPDCVKAYGNLSLEQCTERCCSDAAIKEFGTLTTP